MKKLFPASTRLRFPIKKEYVFVYIYIYIYIELGTTIKYVLMKQPSIKKYTNHE